MLVSCQLDHRSAHQEAEIKPKVSCFGYRKQQEGNEVKPRLGHFFAPAQSAWDLGKVPPSISGGKTRNKRV